MDIWKPSTWVKPRTPHPMVIEVDNRIFLLGLDELYREAQKRFESQTLLSRAHVVAKRLQVRPANVPIEGYYYESENLTEYFRLIRALQNEREGQESKLHDVPEFQQLKEYFSSSLFGQPQSKGKLLPAGRDALSQALLKTIPDWNVTGLVQSAYVAAIEYDDISMVGLAARLQDAVTLAAVRESTVLYAELESLAFKETPQIKWCVDPEFAVAANQFIDTFNRFVPAGLPHAVPDNADKFYKGYSENEIIGRCVRIGTNEGTTRHYHWAIAIQQTSEEERKLEIDEFWSDHIWTTDKYRKFQQYPLRMKLFNQIGVPEKEWEWL